jgi:multimeric flavodoxin WrbA
MRTAVIAMPAAAVDNTDQQSNVMTKRTLLIVAHAPSPNTRQLLNAVVDGAESAEAENVVVRAVSPFEAMPRDVLAAGAVILGTPENLGYMSGALKDFFDRIYYPCLEQTQGLAYALYVRAGHDGTGTRRAVETIVTGLRWRAVHEPLICRGAWQESFIGNSRNLGAMMAAGLDLGLY